MLELQTTAAGVILNLRVRPGSRKNAIQGEHAGMLKVAVTAAPERGKANAAVIELLAKTLGIARSKIEIVHGHTSSDKRVQISGLDANEVESRLATSIPDTTNST